MDLKLGKVLVGAVVAASVGSFAIPFCPNATASTGIAAPRQLSSYVQLADEEHHELKEKTENKVDELKGDAAAVPNAVEAEHEEHEANEATENEEHGSLRHRAKEKAERHVDEMGSDVKAGANAVESEHEAHEMNDR
jgi:hypothetical protein